MTPDAPILDLVYNIDWLSCSYKLTLSLEEIANGVVMNCPEGFCIMELPGTNIFKRRLYLLSDTGEKLLTLLWEPFSKVLDELLLFVEVANPMLYNGKWYYLLTSVLPMVHACTFNNVARIDLCADWQRIPSRYAVIDKLARNKYYVSKKRKCCMFADLVSRNDHVRRDVVQISYGSHQSAMTFKVYDKSKELLENIVDGRKLWSKPYIVSQWEAMGMDVDNVWRWEVSIKDAGRMDFYSQNIDLNDLNDSEWRMELLAYCYHNNFKVRKNQGHKNKNNDEQVKFLPIPEPVTIEQGQLAVREPVESMKDYGFVSMLNNLMKVFIDPKCYLSGSSESMKAAIVDVVARHNLEDYLWKTYGCYTSNLLQWQENKMKEQGIKVTKHPLREKQMTLKMI